MKVLVVEDNRDMSDSLRDILDMTGCTVAIARDGAETVAQFAPGRFDLVLMDLKIPGLSGADLIEHLFRLDPRVRIVVLTGNSVKEEIDALSSLPILQVIRKPYDPAILLSLVEQLQAKS